MRDFIDRIKAGELNSPGQFSVLPGPNYDPVIAAQQIQFAMDELAQAQEPLGQDFEKALIANMSDLYEQ